MTDRGPVIRLQGGPGDGQAFYEEDFRERIIAAHRMGRTTPDGPGWALSYQEPTSGTVWVWRGVNCHPRPDNLQPQAPGATIPSREDTSSRARS